MPPIIFNEYAEALFIHLCREKLAWPPSCIILKPIRAKSSPNKTQSIIEIMTFGVKKTRIFFLGVLFVFVSLVFLFNGLSLIQSAFFTYSMWSNEIKFVVALMLGGIEFLGATALLIFLFKEETWGRFSGIQKVVNLVVNEDDKNNELTGHS